MEKIKQKKKFSTIILVLCIFMSCSHKKEIHHTTNTIDSLLIDYYSSKNNAYKQSDNYNKNQTNVKTKHCGVYNYVDSLVINNKILIFKNFEKEKIIIPDSFFIGESLYFPNLESFDTREMKILLKGRKEFNLPLPPELPKNMLEYLCKKGIMGDFYEDIESKPMSAYYLGKFICSNLFDTRLLFFESTWDERKGSLDKFLLINTKNKAVKSVIEVASFVSGRGEAFKTKTRTNKKYFYIQTEFLASDCIREELPIEEMSEIPKNIEFYTQFYFDENGYVKFVEE